MFISTGAASGVGSSWAFDERYRNGHEASHRRRRRRRRRPQSCPSSGESNLKLVVAHASLFMKSPGECESGLVGGMSSLSIAYISDINFDFF